MLGPDALVNANRVRIHMLSLSAQLPTVYGFRGYVEVGGLMSYGADFTDLFRRTAELVDKILRGGKPADIPWSNRQNSSWSSTSRLPKRSASPFPTSCLRSPTG